MSRAPCFRQLTCASISHSTMQTQGCGARRSTFSSATGLRFLVKKLIRWFFIRSGISMERVENQTKLRSITSRLAVPLPITAFRLASRRCSFSEARWRLTLVTPKLPIILAICCMTNGNEKKPSGYGNVRPRLIRGFPFHGEIWGSRGSTFARTRGGPWNAMKKHFKQNHPMPVCCMSWTSCGNAQEPLPPSVS